MPAETGQKNADGTWAGPGTFPEDTLKYFDFTFKGKTANHTGYVPNEALLKALSSNDPSLTVLDCENRALDDDVMAEIMEALKGNTVVTELKLARNLSHWNEQGDKFGLALAPILAASKSITSVDLHNNDLHEKSCTAIAEALKINKSITSLNFEDNFARKNAADFGDMLKVNTSLTHLNMNVNQLQDEEAKYLLECLKANTTIKEFTAFNNGALSKEVRKELRGFKK
jgi:Ran GTPase-activating protein (RanGAP) involved in mRNA processing and transport